MTAPVSRCRWCRWTIRTSSTSSTTRRGWADELSMLSAAAWGVVPARHDGAGLTLPLVPMDDPYVEYELDDAAGLVGVRMSREGVVCRPGGLSDVGVFCLGTDSLPEAWA